MFWATIRHEYHGHGLTHNDEQITDRLHILLVYCKVAKSVLKVYWYIVIPYYILLISCLKFKTKKLRKYSLLTFVHQSCSVVMSCKVMSEGVRLALINLNYSVTDLLHKNERLTPKIRLNLVISSFDFWKNIYIIIIFH